MMASFLSLFSGMFEEDEPVTGEGQDENSKNIWEDQKTRVPNQELKSMVEAYKTRAPQAREQRAKEAAKAASVHKRCFAIDRLKAISHNKLKIISLVGGTMTTRERIIEEALTLFAENGYDGTGVERIAERVGIKAPSLYKHFKGKEDILNAIIDETEARYEKSFGSAENTGKFPENKEEFLQITMGKVLFTMHDPMIRKIRIFLVKEQFRSERLAKINTKHQVDGLQKMYTKILTAMMEKGLLKTDDPSLLALELISPAVVLIAKADRQPKCDEEVQESIEKHLRHFCDMYMKEANGI